MKFAGRLVAVCSGLCWIVFIIVGIAGVFYPYDFDLYEGTIITPSLRLVSGPPIYGNDVIFQEPFVYASSGPVYYLLVGLFLQIAGAGFWAGRLISLVATIGMGFLIYKSVRSNAGNTVGGLLAATVFLMTPPAWTFGNLFRYDATGIFFAALTITLVLCARGEEDKRWFLAGCAATLAFLVKSPLIGASASIIVCLMLRRERNALGRFALGCASILLIAFICLLLTGNLDYWLNQQANADTAFEFRTALDNIRGMAQSHTVIVAFALVIMSLPLFGLRRCELPGLLPVVYLLIAGLLGLIICGRRGANVNYFYEFSLALAFAVGRSFTNIETERRPIINTAAGLLIVAMMVELVAFRSGSIQGRMLLPARKAPAYERVIEELRTYVPETEPVASEYPDLVLRSGRRLYFNDWVMYSTGPEPMREVLNEYLEQQKLGAIVLITPGEFPGYLLVKESGYTDPYCRAASITLALCFIFEKIFGRSAQRRSK